MCLTENSYDFEKLGKRLNVRKMYDFFHTLQKVLSKGGLTAIKSKNLAQRLER